MSKERDIIHEMITAREEVIRVNHRILDSLYERFDINVPRDRVEATHAENVALYNGCLLLKNVLLKADGFEVGE